MNFTIKEMHRETRGIAIVWPANRVTLISRGQNTWLFRGWGTVVFDESSLDGGRTGDLAGPPGTIEVYEAELPDRAYARDSEPDNPLWLRVTAPQRRDGMGLTQYAIEMSDGLRCIVLPDWAYRILAARPSAASDIYLAATLCADLLDGWNGSCPPIADIKVVIEQMASARLQHLIVLQFIRNFQKQHEAKLAHFQSESPADPPA